MILRLGTGKFALPRDMSASGILCTEIAPYQHGTGIRGGYLIKFSTVMKVTFRLGFLLLLAFALGWRPSNSFLMKLSPVSKSMAKLNGRQFAQFASESTKTSTKTANSITDGTTVSKETSVQDEDSLCLPMGERERKRAAQESGVDVIRYAEQVAKELHSAKIPERQLEVVAHRFDHASWSRAWLSSASAYVKAGNDAGTGRQSAAHNYASGNVASNGVLPAETMRNELGLQLNLGHATLFLSRYNRLLENGRRQEASALRAFHWQEEIRQEINNNPIRILVRSYLPYTCSGTDTTYYGCQRGETIYRVKALLSPRIACRFPEKREQYAVSFWIRVQGRKPRILEVESGGQRLVKSTYDELVHREMLSALAPNVGNLLMEAGLEPFRALILWRLWNRPAEVKADAKTQVKTEHSHATPARRPATDSN